MGALRANRTQVIQLVLAFWLAGLWLARYAWQVNPRVTLLAGLLLLVLVAFRRWQLAALPLVVLAFALGINRGAGVFNSFRPLLQKYNQNIQVVGQIQDDAAPSDRAQTEFHLGKLHIINGDKEEAVGGRLNIRGFANTKLQRGDVVVASGKLRPSLGNKQGQMSYANIEQLAQNTQLSERLRQRFLAGVYSALPEPQASLGLGFLVGTRSLLPDNLLNQLTATGLTHIVAVSGYNLTILVRFMRRLFASNSKFLATFGSIGLIVAFIGVTGMSPSIMRAAIVSGLALLAWYYGRTFKPVLLILLAAAITAGVNPTYIWYDIGWYLSFLTFFGIMVIAPAILWRFYPNKRAPALVQLLCETSVAQLMALPLIMYIFKQVSLVAVPANLFILPLIPVAMLSSLLAGLSGMLAAPIAGWLAWPASLILGLIVKIVEAFASFKYAQVERALTGAELWLVYSGVVIFTIALRKNMSEKARRQYSIVV